MNAQREFLLEEGVNNTGFSLENVENESYSAPEITYAYGIRRTRARASKPKITLCFSMVQMCRQLLL